jgi:hypothetical protein
MITFRAIRGGDSAGSGAGLGAGAPFSASSLRIDRRTLRRGDVGGKRDKCGAGMGLVARGAATGVSIRYSVPSRYSCSIVGAGDAFSASGRSRGAVRSPALCAAVGDAG